jgi:uncharacterized membrane protein (UPF0127 family)
VPKVACLDRITTMIPGISVAVTRIVRDDEMVGSTPTSPTSMTQTIYKGLLGAGIILLLGWMLFSGGDTELQIGNAFLKVEVAETNVAKAKGLSQRESLNEDGGMLFLFKEPGHYGIWMKDMNFPIDIIWVNEAKKIVEITPNVTPDTFPKTFYSKEPIQYVLEVQAGWAGEHSILKGDTVTGL